MSELSELSRETLTLLEKRKTATDVFENNPEETGEKLGLTMMERWEIDGDDFFSIRND